MRYGLPCLVLLSWAISACDTSTTIESTSAGCFELCLSADANVDVKAHLAVASDVVVALDSVRKTAASAFDGAAGLSGVVDALIHGRLRKPNGFTYEGNGVYRVDNGDGSIARVTYYQGRNTSFGNALDPIKFDLFDSANYFTSLKLSSGVSVGLSGIDTNAELSFESTGPGAELLGLQSKTSGSIKVDEKKMTAALTETRVRALVEYTPNSDVAVTGLTTSIEEVAASKLATTMLALSFDELTAENRDLSQTVAYDSTATTTLRLTGGGRGYDGNLKLNSRSPSFRFDAQLRFSGDTAADIAFGCAGSDLSFPD